MASSQAGIVIDRMVLTMAVPVHSSILPALVGVALFGLIINLALALFNLLPIPPLDGHWMLLGLLPYTAASLVERLGSYGFILLYILMFAGVLRIIFVPVQWILLLLIAL